MAKERGITRILNMARKASSAREALDAPLTGKPFGVQRALKRWEPPRGLPARMRDLMANETVRKRVGDTIDRGVEDGGHLWYDTAPIYAAFVRELGEEEAPQAFKTYMGYVAATSPRSSVGENIRNASYFYNLDRVQEPIPFQPPSPYGHFAQGTHRPFIERVRAGDELGDPVTASKVTSFYENLTGNQTPATIDSHAFALPAMFSEDPRFLKTSIRYEVPETGEVVSAYPRDEYSLGLIDHEEAMSRPYLWGGRPLKTEYGALERFYGDLAAERGLTPAQAQSSAWIAGGDETGVRSAYEPFTETFKARVALTAAERGESEEKVLRDFIRGRAPLLSLAGAASGAGILGALGSRRDRMDA